jgi:hypothetical protein
MKIKDIEYVIELLESVKSSDGRFPKELFYASARLFGESCLELCIFKTINSTDYVFLFPRPESDPYWPKLLHLPGVRKLTTDSDESVLVRVVGETLFDIELKDIYYCSSQIVKTKRGTEFSDVRWTEVVGDDMDNFFYDVDNLPRNIIEFHPTLIYKAAECYRRYKYG